METSQENMDKPVKRRGFYTDDDPPPYYPVYQNTNPDDPQNQEKYDPKPVPQNQEKYVPKPVPQNQFNDKERMASKISEWGSILLIISGIITLIISIITYCSIGSYDGAIVDFKLNWNLRPITDIKTALHECPSGYEDLISSEWPGTSEGCDCTYSSKHYSSRLQSSMCSVNETIAGCRDIPAVKSIPINKFYSYRICGKRSGDSFVNMQRPIREFGGSKIECGYGYKLCGTGGRDNSVCVRDSQECPLNHIYIEILSDLSKIPEGYKAQPLDGGQYVLFTSNSDRLPTVRLKLAEGNVCADPNKGDFTSGRSHYKLLRYQSRNGCTSKIAGSYLDPRYRMIGTIKEDRLYNDNGISYVVASLPYYPAQESSSYHWNLYSSDYYSWSASCDDYGTFNRSSLLDMLNDSSDVLSFSGWLIFVCIVQLTVYLFASKELKDAIHLTFLALSTYLFYMCVNSTKSHSAQMQKLSSEQCFDNHTQMMFTEYYSALIGAIGYADWGLIITEVSLCVTIAMLIQRFVF